MPAPSPSVRQVSMERWKEAQQYERQTWIVHENKTGWRRLAWPFLRPLWGLVKSRRVGDDWNHWWAQHFSDYRDLPPQMDNYIEVGCGAYTNTRIITRDRDIKHIFCSDPLARTYVTFQHGWLAKQHRRGAVLIDDHPIEECPFRDNYFDTVVMINVLDHVRDSDLCIRNVIRILKPGGHLVIGQDLSNEEDPVETSLEPGHPIRLVREDIECHLTDFKPIICKALSREEGRAPHQHYSTLIFLGRKLPLPSF